MTQEALLAATGGHRSSNADRIHLAQAGPVLQSATAFLASIPTPSSYKKQQEKLATETSAEPVVLAINKIVPRIGPIHGVHPAPKVSPTI